MLTDTDTDTETETDTETGTDTDTETDTDTDTDTFHDAFARKRGGCWILRRASTIFSSF